MIHAAEKGLIIDALFINRGHTIKAMYEGRKQFRAEIKDDAGGEVFVLDGVEAPHTWSQQAVNIVASKYFWKGAKGRETSVFQLVERVVADIVRSGVEQGYFIGDQAVVFHDELSLLLLNQMAAFNSPVWFNVGVHKNPQSSACFINSVGDNMESITDLAKTEMLLFKFGSGTGTNFSTLRSSKEWSTKGGFKSSGPVSFMKGFDAFAGIIKSGGKTRRAAKMVILNANHPDIREFITCKTAEEAKAHALIQMGYSPEFNKAGGAYDSISYQNANHSVRVTDEFMEAVSRDGMWDLHGILDGKTLEVVRAREIWDLICESTWRCGDPGIQFDTPINLMHTCSSSGRINASNPCSEYMFLDDSACNLASINLMHFIQWGTVFEDLQASFDEPLFEHAVELLITAMDIIVGMSSYPTPAIAKNSRDFRPLGLGYANLGAVLMSAGIPYDSVDACAFTNVLTGKMSGYAYRMSGKLAQVMEPFVGFEKNQEAMLTVLHRHCDGAIFPNVDKNNVVSRISACDDQVAFMGQLWEEVLGLAEDGGIRNSQISVIAPTGTIAFMMDCDTTGIEPDLALTKYKKLVGGGTMKIVNQSVDRALTNMGLPDFCRTIILGRLAEGEGTIEELLESVQNLGKSLDPAVFDCAYPGQHSRRYLDWRSHLNIMAAAQPFISGAISKTVNVPENMTREEIGEVYMLGWKLGLKSVAVYREGSKKSQPLDTKKKVPTVGEVAGELALRDATATDRPRRRRMPDERHSITHKFSLSGHEGYLTVGLYEDGTPGELFVTIAKEGSTVSGLMDTVATMVSISLQNGVPLESLVSKFRGQKFEPAGFTSNPKIRMATSITDYVFRWLGQKFIPGFESGEIAHALGVVSPEQKKPEVPALVGGSLDSPACSNCGGITQRAGACYVCPACGTSGGCG